MVGAGLAARRDTIANRHFLELISLGRVPRYGTIFFGTGDNTTALSKTIYVELAHAVHNEEFFAAAGISLKNVLQVRNTGFFAMTG